MQTQKVMGSGLVAPEEEQKKIEINVPPHLLLEKINVVPPQNILQKKDITCCECNGSGKFT